MTEPLNSGNCNLSENTSSVVVHQQGHRDVEGLTPQIQVFELIGVLEQILSFSDATDVASATAVNRRWKRAGRRDEIWKAFIRQAWQDKKGVTSDSNMIFWRSLFSREAVRAMKQDDVLCMFRHPLLQTQYKSLEEEISKTPSGNASPEVLQRVVQVHMLDVMSEGSGDGRDDDSTYQRRVFFTDLYFGSYASSVLDAKRSVISQHELCTPFGFEMHFKIEEEDADDVIAETHEELQRYDEAEGILLYRHSTCYFCPDRDFRLVLRPNVAPTYRPNDLRWRWLQAGKEIQVGPYPPLTVSRTKDWGWKLENLHVVMYSNHGSWPPPQRQVDDEENEDDNDSWGSDSDSSGILDYEDDDFLVNFGL